LLHETWRDQYERLQRSYELLKQVGEPTLMPQEVIPARDVLFHFCCDVFHLRDWIAADLGTDEASTKRIAQRLNDDVIFPSPELSACCDIANGSKHLTLTQNSYVTREKQGHAEVVNHGITLGVPTAVVVVPKAVAEGFLLRGTGPPVEDPVGAKAIESPPVPVPAVSSADNGFYQDSFTIDINGQQHDAQDVAAKAVAAWDQWIKGSPLAAQLS
jgi:hypothetical protein